MVPRTLAAFALLALLATACGSPDASAAHATPAVPVDEAHDATAPAEPIVLRPTRWLGLEAVDHRGRRPLRPDAVLARHLLSDPPTAPRAGDTLRGERDVEHAWTEYAADGKGGPADAPRLAWAHTQLVAPSDGVWLARLAGAAQLVVNGAPVFGDYYALGSAAVPVRLRAGDNSVFVHGVRGGFRLEFTEATAPLDFAPRADVLPDLARERGRVGPVGLGLRNQRDAWARELEIVLLADTLFEETRARVAPRLAPLELTRVPVPQRLRASATLPTGVETWARRAELRDASSGEVLAVRALELRVRESQQPRRVTFLSRLDGSVQFYGLREPQPLEPSKREESHGVLPGVAPDAGLVLSLHGASVDAFNQAAAYAALPDFWIVAPTNRGKFGFDWQDWGREDAYEVLDHALARSGVARERVMLSGHSMGGHGTWHVAANDPDGFAAIAPSAGWVSFDSYGGRPDGSLRELWHAADAASDTLALLDNLVPQPTFVLHGSDDDNVPPDQARTMLDALAAAGASPGSHFQEGAGHWWDGDAAPGADCLTWPAIFELFRESTRARDPESLRVTSVHPSVDSRHHWVSLLQPARYGEPLHVEGAWRDGVVELSTRNVARVRVHRVGGRALDGVRLDGQDVALGSAAGGRVDPEFARRDGRWELAQEEFTQRWATERAEPTAAEHPPKSPAAGGPFKRAFDERFVLVVGTAGDDAMDAALLVRARALASEWTYRANGRAPIVSDEAWLADRDVGRPILLGNADTNSAWAALLGGAVPGGRAASVAGVVSSVPVRVADELVVVGEQQLRGDDLVAAFVAPTAHGLVGALGFSGERATRVANVLAPFVSGAGFPDYLVFDSSALQLGDGGVRAAGWFTADWSLQDCAGSDCPPARANSRDN